MTGDNPLNISGEIKIVYIILDMAAKQCFKVIIIGEIVWNSDDPVISRIYCIKKKGARLGKYFIRIV